MDRCVYIYYISDLSIDMNIYLYMGSYVLLCLYLGNKECTFAYMHACIDL